MGRSRNRTPAIPAQVQLVVESIDLEGNGVGHVDGKVHFVDGAITGETVVAEVTRSKPSYARAITRQVLSESALRVKPKCPHFGVCGGCAVQHIEPDAQVAIKNRALEDLLERIGRQKPEQMMRPMVGPSWGYRHRARLTVRFVEKKGGMLVGFHEKGSSYVATMTECHVLPKRISDLLVPIGRMLETLSIYTRIPQLELAVGQGVTALVLRHLEPLSASDLETLRSFGRANDIDWWLQPEGPATAYRLEANVPRELAYHIPSFGVQMRFRPTDFTQVNHLINDSMVSRAVSLLDLKPEDRVLDLFCGLGNFSLPLATRSRFVKGFEGSQDLVDRAGENAVLNGLQGKTEFHVRNLFEVESPEWESWGQFDKVLIDPPRDGALAICKAIVGAKPAHQPSRIVYVSCNPATLARDVAVLCCAGPYVLKQAGVINMFPHTSHVESIAVFERRADWVPLEQGTDAPEILSAQ
ncbi:MAG TPA: 23S rRNA (uracil(1939)-C(5))-methyltransferase RlmD [Limnobacter sp.]|uniref:23S rRNA (uracil(1939)-C(5))-methyltransferase RlmD n=1 Tax=Limnobacter sp. TaxID=2003368 RepID=UPI002EDA0236